MEARGALLGDESYAPPVYDEVAGTIRTAPEQPKPSPPYGGTTVPPRPRVGQTRGTGKDEYVALGEDDAASADPAQQREQRANEIAMSRQSGSVFSTTKSDTTSRRQQEHAAAFQRQMVAEEEFLRSSQKQVARDAEVAAKLAAGGAQDEAVAMDALQQSQRDAALAAQLQRELDAAQGPPPVPRRGGPPSAAGSSGDVTEKRKVVRVLVPPGARSGDSLAVSTPTTGKFEVRVPAWASPGSHFDCQVTTIVQVKRPGEATASFGGYTPPSTTTTGSGAGGDVPPLPGGWERGVSQDGTPFYIDHNTRTTHWTPPPAPQASASSGPPAANPDVAPAGMTEEEMLAEAIARSLAGNDGPPQETTSNGGAPQQQEETPPPPPEAAPAAAQEDTAPNLLDLDAPAAPAPGTGGAQ